MEATIMRHRVYKHVMSGEPFDMIWVTGDLRRRTGGDVIRAEGWMVCGERKPAGSRKSETVTKTGVSVTAEADFVTKDPHHPENGTVNIYNPANPGQRPYTVHWDLIIFFEGKRVIN